MYFPGISRFAEFPDYHAKRNSADWKVCTSGCGSAGSALHQDRTGVSSKIAKGIDGARGLSLWILQKATASARDLVDGIEACREDWRAMRAFALSGCVASRKAEMLVYIEPPNRYLLLMVACLYGMREKLAVTPMGMTVDCFVWRCATCVCQLNHDYQCSNSGWTRVFS